MKNSNFYNIVQNNKKEFENKNITVLYEGFEPIELWYLMIHFKELKINQIQLIEPIYGTKNYATIYNMITIKKIPDTFNEFADIVDYEDNEAESLYPDDMNNIIKNSDLFVKFGTKHTHTIYLDENTSHIKAIYDNDEILEWDYYFPKPEAIELTFGRIRFKKGNTDLVLKFNNRDIMLDFEISMNELKAEAGIEPFWGQEFLRKVKKLLNHYAELN